MRGVTLIVAVAVTMLVSAATANAATNVTISNGATTNMTGGPNFTATAENAVLNAIELSTYLENTGSATVSTANIGTQQGDVTVNNLVSWTSGNSLTILGVGSGSVNAPITSNDGPGGFTMNMSLGITETASGTIDVAGLTSVQSGLSSIILTSAGNDFGQLTVPGAPGGVLLTDANAIALAGVNTNSSFTLNAASVSQTAALSVGGLTQISSPGTIQLNAANSFTGSVNIPVGGNTALNATGNLTLGQIAVGTLDVTAGAQLLGSTTVTAGQTTLAAPTSISLTAFTNNFTGPVSINTNGVATLRDANNLTLGTVASNGADVFSEGAMTQTGAINDTGQFEVQGDGGVTLTNASNNFDDLSVSSDGGAAAVRDADSVNLRAVEVTGSGAATVVAGNDLVVPDENTFFTAGAMTLVSDANAGFSALGPGGIEIAGDRAIASTAAPVRLYTAQRNQNSISALATLNGATFTPGPEFVDSATEVWNTAFPAGSATNPFTIFYKQAAPVVPPPVDPPTPDTTLTKTPKKKIKTKKSKVKVAFEFSSTVAGSTFACTLDGKATACASPFKARVKKGKHEFEVVASAAGKTDPTPATFTFKVKRKPKHR